jgi:hypothetical protein
LGRIIIGTFFNGDLRTYDISDQYRPDEAVFVPDAPRHAPTGAGFPACKVRRVAQGAPKLVPAWPGRYQVTAIQLNGVFVDEPRSCTPSIGRTAAYTYWRCGSVRSACGSIAASAQRSDVVARPAGIALTWGLNLG